MHFELNFADTEIGFAAKFATEISEESRFRVLTWDNLTPTFINGFLKESADILSHFVFESIKTVVLCVLTYDCFQAKIRNQ